MKHDPGHLLVMFIEGVIVGAAVGFVVWVMLTY
jgi:F0F1-type ATP synthase assembly protein I